MEKDYGLEYEREVLAAFDRMKEKYENPGIENSTGDTKVFTKDQKNDMDAMLADSPQDTDAARGAGAAAVIAVEKIEELEAAPAEEPEAEDRLAEPEEGDTDRAADRGLTAAAGAVLGAELYDAVNETAPEAAEKEKADTPSEAEAPSEENTAAETAAEAAAAAKAAEKAEKKAAREAKKAERKAKKEAKMKEEEEEEEEEEKGHRRRGRFLFIKFLLWFLIFCFMIGLAVAGFVGYKVLEIIKDTPEINPDNIYELLGENSVILDADGEFLENVYRGSALRTNIEYKDLPENLINAFVCIEDKTFFEHKGFNVVRIVGAVVQKVVGDSERIGGTSTITQQLARNLYLSDVKNERSMTRKIREAYYTLVLESSLTKEQILEAYLNTIYLGYNCNGISAAAEAYFSKDVQDLELMECAALAALPQSPNNYAPIKRATVASVSDPESLDIISKDDEYIIYFNDAAKDRIELVLFYMHDQGKIDDKTYEKALADSIRNYINPGTNATSYSKYSYFVDYVKEVVLEDLQNYMGYTAEEASSMLYQGGLTIHSTLDTRIQDIVENVYSNPDNFPDVGTLRKDKAGNILYQEGDRILLYSKSNMFNEEGDFVLKPDEFQWLPNGDLQIFKGNRLNIYNTTVGGKTDYSIEFKGFYEVEDKKFYSYTGGVWSIGADFKTRNDNGDVIISADYFESVKDAFTKNDDGTVTLNNGMFTISQRILQPQSAMTIMDYTTSHLVAMIGGRGIEGKLLYNRATSTRQPGSSIKPLAVYSTALQAGVDGLGNFTAAMPIEDMPIKRGNSLWPKNWYSGYTGITNLRHAVEQSINACAVQLYLQLDPQLCINNLQGMGITSLVTSGSVNDMNASALALGGMSRGISPLEMTGAYGTFGNYGTYTEPICYTLVTNKRGDVIIDKHPVTHKVMDESVASLMTDILRTTVTNGLASAAKMKTSETAGKTGTTSEKYDIWFCGLTPRYSAAVWIGNDVNISLKQGSSSAVQVWKKVMEEVAGLYDDYLKFEMKGEFVRLTVDKYSGKLLSNLSGLDSRGSAISEIFIKGTEPTESDTSHVLINVCAASGYLATPYCDNVIQKLGIVRPNGQSWESLLADWGMSGMRSLIPDARYDVPTYYCPIHNPDTGMYPISPSGATEAEYNPMDIAPEPEEPEIQYYDANGNPLDPEGYDDNNRPVYSQKLYDINGMPVIFDAEGNVAVPTGTDVDGMPTYKGEVYDSTGYPIILDEYGVPVFGEPEPQEPLVDENGNPIDPNVPVDPNDPGQQPVNPENPQDPGQQPADPNDPGQQPVNPENPQDPGQQPADPNDPGQQPVNPENPQDPGQQPADPNDPGQQPVNPENPQDPGQQPADPDNPANPDDPNAQPDNPGDPQNPEAPGEPSDPQQPVDPDNPVEIDGGDSNKVDENGEVIHNW